MEAHTKLSPVEAEEIRSCLASVLASSEFASSERCRRLLEFVVNRTLAQEESQLKELNIAREVFDRPQYDPSEDSFVRVKAADVRRRLAEYNRHNATASWRIELPTGRYQAVFSHTEVAPAAAKQEASQTGSPESGSTQAGSTQADSTQAGSPQAGSTQAGSTQADSSGREGAIPMKRARWKLGVLYFSAASILLIGAVSVVSRPSESLLQRVWRPVLEENAPLLIFVPTPRSFVLGTEGNDRWRSGQLQALPNSTLSKPIAQSDLIYFPDKVGLGAAAAAVRFSVLCAGMGHSSQLRFGRDLALVDLRSRPAVILGAFSSPWAEELNNAYRFRLRSGRDRGMDSIVDSQVPGRVWTPQLRQDRWPVVDYAVAARILHPVTGHYIFVAAGVYTFGTESAAEFLTDERELKMLDSMAPPGWYQKNFQVVLKVDVIGNSPGSPNIVAWKVW